MIEELKPCPFCGGEAKIFAYNNGGMCVKCTKCSCQTESDSDVCYADWKRCSVFERVIEVWNRRIE